jgi:DNA-directed RNA polymerase subunit RPC12/RpoP
MKKKKINTDYMKRFIQDKYGGEYTLIGEYKNRNLPITLKHETCGHTFKKIPGNILYTDQACSACGWKRLSKSRVNTGLKSFTKFLDGKFEIVGNYEAYAKPITLKGVECGHTFETEPALFKKRPYCRECRKKKITVNEFMDIMDKMYNREVFILDFYAGPVRKIKFFDKKCNKEFWATPHQLMKGVGRPICEEADKNG